MGISLNSTALKVLNCSNNYLSRGLNLSRCPELTTLTASNCCPTIDMSNNSKLTFIDVSDNSYITSLDVSGCPELDTLTADKCQLEAIDLSSNTKLTTLNVDNNVLTALDVAKCTALKRIYCYGNKLTSLDLTQLPSLEDIEVSPQQLDVDLVTLSDTAVGFKVGNSFDISKVSLLRVDDKSVDFEPTTVDVGGSRYFIVCNDVTQAEALKSKTISYQYLTGTDATKYSCQMRVTSTVNSVNTNPVSGITNVRSDVTGNNGNYYNLQGIRVNTPKKGKIYIHNGKKIVLN